MKHLVAATVTSLGLISVQAQTAPPAAGDTPLQWYGQLAAAVNHNTDWIATEKATALGNSPLSASWLGLRGNRQFGNDLVGLYRIETGLDLANGKAGSVLRIDPADPSKDVNKLFNRQAFVGLTYKSFVTATVGRQFHASTDRVVQSVDLYNVAGTSLASAPLGLFGVNRFYGNDNRVDNSLKLRFRAPGDMTAAFSVARDSAAGDSHAFDLAKVNSQYALGVYGASFTSPLARADGLKPKHTILGVGGHINTGPWKLYANVVNSDLDNANPTRATQTNRIVHLGAAWQASEKVTLRLGHYHDKGANINGLTTRSGTKTTLIGSLDYALDKDLTLQAGITQNKLNDGYALDPVNRSALKLANGNNATTGITLGVRYTF